MLLICPLEKCHQTVLGNHSISSNKRINYNLVLILGYFVLALNLDLFTVINICFLYKRFDGTGGRSIGNTITVDVDKKEGLQETHLESLADHVKVDILACDCFFFFFS